MTPISDEQVLTRFVTGIPSRYEVAEGNLWLHGVLVEVDETSGRATSIERISEQFD